MKALDGQGATPERKKHSNIVSGIREITKGGMPLTHGDREPQHCTLDILKDKGFIDDYQYDAGMDLRHKYYQFNKSATSCHDEKTGGYEGDHVTEQDMAEMTYYRALDSIDKSVRSTVRDLCISLHPSEVAVSPMLFHANDIRYGFDDLVKFFKENKKKTLAEIK